MKNEYVEYTSVDDLIKELKEISDKGFGDLPVCVNGVSPVQLGERPWYYDGGYIVKDANGGNWNFLRSRLRSEDGKSMGMRQGVKSSCIDIEIYDPTTEKTATIDGRPTRVMNVDTWSFLDKIEQEEMAVFGGPVKYKLSPTYDEKLKCHPFTAYLDSGESAIGHNMADAKEKLRARKLAS